MTKEDIQLKDLNKTFATLKETVMSSLKDEEKHFLLSFKRKDPNWNLLGLDGIDQLPAVKWKQLNLERMDAERHKEAYYKLQEFLS
ncbi:MAG: hypothetical protein SCALA702_33020 [Melioribacteraceae bacterium]|nr:MAG: hypothetical protein SCALA702_33020 [Melioribacteraceae bacterium]